MSGFTTLCRTCSCRRFAITYSPLSISSIPIERYYRVSHHVRYACSTLVQHSSFFIPSHSFSLSLLFSLFLFFLNLFFYCVYVHTYPLETHFENRYTYILYIFIYSLFSSSPSLSISVHLISLSLSLYISVYLYESESVLYTLLPYYKDWTEGFLCVFFFLIGRNFFFRYLCIIYHPIVFWVSQLVGVNY